MDLRLSDEDRVGPARRNARGRAANPRPGRVQIADDERRERSTRGRRTRKPVTFFGIVLKLVYWGFVLALWAGIAAVGVVVYYGMKLPSSDQWALPERPANIRIVAADGQLISNRGQMGGEAVALRELPDYVAAAIVASEDRRFMSHFGVDPIGLISVAIESVQAGEITRGASTITQQVAKNLFLTPDQTLERKVQEVLLALWLEQNYTKDQILELYINRVHFGAGATGIEAAAQIYFGKSARNLSLGEAAMLAGILPAPASYNPRSHPERAVQRQRLSLAAMVREGYITEEEAAAAAIDPSERVRTRVAGSESYVADWVEGLITAYVGEIGEDVIVSTTIDWDLQKHAEFLVHEMVANNGEAQNFSQAALVAMDVDGTVRAIVGGADYNQSQYNRAVTARRQPGSTFKPFVYLTGLERGYTPESIADDQPFTYEGWSPQNASNQFYGQVTLRQALANSLNTIAARLAIDVGPQNVVDTARRLGISSPMMAVPSIALGTQEVSLLELTAAYAPFANGGQGVIAHVITRITTADGTVLYEDTAAGPGQVVEPQNVAMMNDMLTTALETGTGRRAHLDGWPIAGKTGTSQNARDALFVGYSARMVAGIWLGNDDDTATTLTGGTLPVELWSEFMLKAHEGIAVASLPGAYQTSPMPGDMTPLGGGPTEQVAVQPPATTEPRSRTTIVDIIGGLFGN